MEETINLRSYIITLINHWKWLLGASLFGAVTALGISSLISQKYQATSLIFVTEPSAIIQFDPRIQTIVDSQNTRAYPEIATSDQMLGELLVQASPLFDETISINQLREMTRAELGSDSSLIRLIVVAKNPEIASHLSNIWAELFVSQVNELFSDQGGNQLEFYEEQLSQAEEALNFAGSSLIDFQSNNRISVVTNTLTFQNQSYSDFLSMRQSLTLLIQDTHALKGQFSENPSESGLSFADQLTVLNLQLKTFGAETGTVPLLFQIDGDSLLTGSDQETQLDKLTATLENKLLQVESLIADIQPEILDLQQELQQLEIEENRLALNFQLAQETYTVLARKVQEEQISSGDTISGARLVSRASIPMIPINSQRFLLILVGMIGSIFFASFCIFFIHWWREDIP